MFKIEEGMRKLAVHKVKTTYPDLFSVVCGARRTYDERFSWRGVTCKKCLKLKPRGKA